MDGLQILYNDGCPYTVNFVDGKPTFNFPTPVKKD